MLDFDALADSDTASLLVELLVTCEDLDVVRVVTEVFVDEWVGCSDLVDDFVTIDVRVIDFVPFTVLVTDLVTFDVLVVDGDTFGVWVCVVTTCRSRSSTLSRTRTHHRRSFKYFDIRERRSSDQYALRGATQPLYTNLPCALM